MTDPGTQRHTGTVRRGALRRPQRPSPHDARARWVAVVGALVVAAGALGWLLGSGAPSDPATASTFAAAGGSAAPPPTEATLEATPELTLRPTPGPPPTSTPEPTPTLRPTPAPTPQLVGLVIHFPVDGEAVRSQRINVIGTAPPGATVTRDIPLWFDDHTTADQNGLWMMPVELAEGENRLTFRVGDDRDTAQVLAVTYRPGP